MFAGLDDVDWASMHHAYGPAVDVPDLLRGLLADDAEVREIALDGLYGAVHHQGDIYDCTIASIPFLLQAVANQDVPDRGGILGLLASIGGADLDGEEDGEGEGEDAASSWYWSARIAHEAVLAGWPTFLGMLADPDPAVRREVPGALLACWEQAAGSLPALQDRLGVEPDPQARLALVEAVGGLGVRAATGRAAGVDRGAVGSWLAGVAADAADPTLRLAALTQLARCAPDMLPSDVVSTVLGLVREAYDDDDQTPAAGTAPAANAEPPGSASKVSPTPPTTLVGAVRQLHERDDAGRRAPLIGDVLHGLHRALGDRVPERIELLVALLRAPDWELWIDAVRSASVLIKGWRGRYQELVALIGKLLAGPEPRLCHAAAAALEDLYELAAPAADALARRLDAAPREGDRPWAGPVLKALARLGDRRALPAVRGALVRQETPNDIGFVIASMGELAADLVPLMGRRLRDLPVVDGWDWRRRGLLVALGGLGDAAAPAMPNMLALLRQERLAAAAACALGRLGATAAEAVPGLRGLLDHPDPEIALAAASALWRIGGDPTPCLPVFRRQLAQGGTNIAAATEGIAQLGPTAAPAVGRLRELLADARAFVRVHAAAALWRAVGDTEATLPVLLAVWEDNVHVRVPVVGYLAEMGTAAGAAVPVLRRELDQVRRHNHDINSSDAVEADEALLRGCSQALTRITRSTPGDHVPAGM
jgi:HEAT repeat protein